MKKIQHALLVTLALLATACGGDNGTDNPDNGPKKEPDTNLKTVTYKLSNGEIANPERGMFTQLEPDRNSFVDQGTLKEMRKSGKTLVQLVYYYGMFTTQELNQSDLDKISVDLDRVREARLKAILRFAYTNKQDGADAPMHIILRHLEQLKPILHKHVAVIACVQAGFIGAWGEWYYSTNKLNNPTAYRQLLDKWLEVLPAERCIQVRTPKYKQDFVGNATPLNDRTAFKNTAAARIAHHNDAFMTDETNMGTYEDIEKDKSYVAQDALYLPLGGETAEPPKNAKLASGEKAWNEIYNLHWSFLNDAYYKPLLKSWANGGWLDKIKKFLGYRIALTKVKFSEQNAPGSDLELNLWFTNTGTACMYNARPACFILRAENGVDEYLANSNIELRAIQPNRPVEFNVQLKLPESLPVGKYKLFMWMPDADPKLQSMPEYAVRLGNNTGWDSKTGYNDLDISINVAKDKNAKVGTSPFVFAPKKRN